MSPDGAGSSAAGGRSKPDGCGSLDRVCMVVVSDLDIAGRPSVNETARPILVTGGAGFIGANFVHYMIGQGHRVVTLDALTYAGNRASLAPLDDNPAHTFVEGSIADRSTVDRLIEAHRPRAIVNFAAESHVDRSIDGPAAFVETNIVGAFTLLEAARAHIRDGDTAFRFLHVSTDEVYGSIADGCFTEVSPYAPNSPYAASKAAADHLVRAYHRTYDLPAIVTNCSNNYGPFQFPEKLIPLIILNALDGRPLPVYGDGRQVRDWIHVADHCRAIAMVLDRGRPGETYLVGGGGEHENIEIVRKICTILDRLRPDPNGGSRTSLIEHVADRPGHDRRYAIDFGKLRRELNWRPEIGLDEGLGQTIRWYLDNRSWWEPLQGRYDGRRLGLGGEAA